MSTTGAQIIGQALANAGATHAFGIPGGEVLAIMQGLKEAGIDFVLSKHENAAGFMAEGLWHASGAPGVLVATLGPGVANAVNTVANAYQDKVPLVFLTGCVDAAEAETYTHQIFDHQALLRPVTKASFRAQTGAVGATIGKAIAIALSGQPGPVHVDVPIGVAEGVSDESTRHAFAPIAPTVAQSEPLEAVRELLQRAQRPLAIAGVDAVNEGASEAISQFCRTHRIPLITTYKGKGLIDEEDTLSIGGAGLSPKADKLILPVIAKSDCILLLGYDPIEMRIGWRDPWGMDQPVIEVTQTPRTHGMHQVSGTLISPIEQALAGLVHDAPKRWQKGEIFALRAALQDAFTSAEWGPGRVFNTMREIMPAETVITADSGAHRILLSQMWTCPGPRQFLQSTGFCTMACSVPIAAGYKLGAPDTPVLAFVGDGGLEMGLGELATLRDLNLPIIICVLVDESLGLIEMKQRGTQRPNLGVNFGGTDFPSIALAMGGHGVWVEDEGALREEAKAALTRDTFTLIAARIGSQAYDNAF